MNRDLKRYVVEGFIIVSVLGTVFHFVYDFLGQNFFIGFFFPVNESTWEHMKLVFIPMWLYSFYGRRFIGNSKAADFAMRYGAIMGTWFVPFIFYSYRGILGFGAQWLDIATFYVSVFMAFVVEYHILKYSSRRPWNFCNKITLVFNLLQLAAFIVFTYLPPNLGIFKL